ncbi:MAG: class I SAM-dependent methyltransferase [Deltaproteobacteria bacterium]|nr:class I SAM-dependent methyltransferase [Deltaproteobacteria bacterium]
MRNEETKTYYDDFSNWYERERHHGYHAMIDALELGVVRPLASGRDALEVGCGTGLIMRGLEGRAHRLVGLDLSRGMLREAHARSFEVVQGTADALPFPDGSFDIVYSFKVLAHVPPIREAMAEMARVLRPGGRIVAEFYNAWSVRFLAKRLARPGRISENRTEAEVYTRWDTPADILSYAPPGVTLEGWRGVRVLTPTAKVFAVPGAGLVLPRLEKLAVESPLARLGGFLVAVFRKN